MKTLTLRVAIFGMILFGINSLHAQANREKKGSRTIQMRFACTGVLKGTSKIKLENGSIVQLRKGNPSAAFKVTVNEAGKASIYREDAVLDEEVKPLSTFSVPSKSKKCLALLIPLENQKKYKAMVISDQQFKFGAITFINLTKVKIGVQIDGRNKLLVNARSKAILDPKSETPIKLLAKMAYQDKQGKWNKFFSSRWMLHPKRKEMIILYYDPKSKRIRFEGISQFADPK